MEFQVSERILGVFSKECNGSSWERKEERRSVFLHTRRSLPYPVVRNDSLPHTPLCLVSSFLWPKPLYFIQTLDVSFQEVSLELTHYLCSPLFFLLKTFTMSPLCWVMGSVRLSTVNFKQWNFEQPTTLNKINLTFYGYLWLDLSSRPEHSHIKRKNSKHPGTKLKYDNENSSGFKYVYTLKSIYNFWQSKFFEKTFRSLFTNCNYKRPVTIPC